MKTSVLHVVESYGGGVVTALDSYRASSPTVEHHLLYSPRSSSLSLDQDARGFASVTRLPANPLSAIRKVRDKATELRPTYVHAHSSLGGLFTRLAVLNRKALPVIYTPHGFAFERRDIGPLKRATFWAAEYLLSFNTQTIAACAPRELQLAKVLPAREAIYLPNIGGYVEPPEREVTTRNGANRTFITVGRISAARDPEYYLRVVRQLRTVLNASQFLWVGDGDSTWRDQLIDAGVEVTGWLPKDEVYRRLHSSDFFIHTGAWDGFPMALLEAHQAGLAPFVRASHALKMAPGAKVSAEELSTFIAKLVNSTDTGDLSSYRAEWQDFLSENTRTHQVKSLQFLYRRTKNF